LSFVHVDVMKKRTRRDRLIHPLTSALSKDTTFYNDVYVATLANELAGASGSNQRGKKTRLLLVVFATKNISIYDNDVLCLMHRYL
jgi:hypothetical protein